jgi:YidC/Oxa1 family membrane protein insertase
MDRRVVLTIVMSVAIVLGWHLLFPGQPPPPKPPPPATAPADPAAAPVEKPAEVIDTVEKPGMYRARFTSWGAGPREWTLLDPHFREHEKGEKDPDHQINLVRFLGERMPLTVTFPDSSFGMPPHAAWEKVEGTPANEIAYRWQDDRVRVEKRYSFPEGSYQARVKVTVENKGDKPIDAAPTMTFHGKKRDKDSAAGRWQNGGICAADGKIFKADHEALTSPPRGATRVFEWVGFLNPNGPIDVSGNVQWFGIDEKYFLVAAALPAGQWRCQVEGRPDGLIVARATHAPEKLAAGQKAEYEFTGFLGPKVLSLLDAVTNEGKDAKMGGAIDYGWRELLARPMLAVLRAAYRVIPNWGIAIILLTVLIKILTWWPNAKSMRSMKDMAKLKPEIDKLKAQCGDDKQRFNVEMMALYKKHGINPLGGCLPILIQMPIYIGLYTMLEKSVELYHAPFFGWIQDLTAPDPYYVTPVVTGALMFLQQRLSPTPPEGQQKALMYMMPIMFLTFTLMLPAGLTVYILTNTVLTMGQQFWLNRGEKKKPATRPSEAKTEPKAEAKPAPAAGEARGEKKSGKKTGGKKAGRK